MDPEGNIVDLSLSPISTPTGRGGSGDYVLGPKWGSNSVTFGFSNLLDGGLPLGTGTSTSDLRQMIYDALGLWTAISGLTLTYMNDPGGAVNDNTYNGSGFPQIRIGHHDIAEPGGSLNTLAHCYYPGSNGRDGDMHFDNSDTWGNGSGTGINFLETATHELGHGIGIDHANGDAVGSCPAVKPAIMDACIQNRFTTRDSAYLFSDDIAAAQAHYGTGLGYLLGQDGIARVYGTGVASNVDGVNVITISTTNIFLVGDCYVVSSSGYGQTIIPTSSINGLIVEGMGGNDILRVDNNFAGKPITLRGGNGDDFFDFGFNSRALGAIPQGVTVEGGAGIDRIWTYDDNTNVAQTYTITSARFDRGGWGGFFYDGGVEGLFLKTGSAPDVVNVLSTFPNQPVTLNNTGGEEVVNIGSGGSVQNIRSDLQINNSPSYTTVNINNGSDTGNRTWLVNDVAAGYGGISGLAPAAIVWNNNDIQLINLTTGSGVDTGSIARLSETFNIGNNASNPGGVFDSITVGNSSAGGLSSIVQGRQGGLTIDNNPSYTSIIIDDTGYGSARNATLDIVASYNQLTGLAPATLRWDDSDTYTTEIRTGNASDTLTVARYHASGGLTLNSAGGADTVNLGNGTDGVRSITASIIVRNTPNFSTLNINNNFDTVARAITVDYDSGADLETLSGVAPANLYWDPGDISSANGVNLTTGSGRDTITVLANERTLNLSTPGASGEEVVFGPDLGRINADVYVRNPPNFTAVTVNDTAYAAGRAIDLGTATVGSEFFSRVTGFGASLYLKAADTSSPIVVNTGSGNDTVTVSSSANTYGVNAGNGNDVLNLGSTAPGSSNLDPINGAVSFDGSGGSDVIYVLDTHYGAAGSQINVNGATVLSDHSAAATYANAEQLTIAMSNAGQTTNVNNALATTPVYVTGGTAHDVINVFGNLSFVQVFNSAGLDDLSIDPLGIGGGGVVYLYQSMDLGALYLGPGARARLNGPGEPLTRVTSANFAGGQIDLTNGKFIINYTGASPISAVRTALLAGRNGGAWNGPGINSSAITPGRALGYAEASTARSVFPATFGAFADIDSTSILVGNTLIGDANMDDLVNFDDLLKVAQSYGPGIPGRIWAQGDFDYNGFVDFGDLLGIAQQYGNAAMQDWQRATARRGMFSSARIDAALLA